MREFLYLENKQPLAWKG